MHSELSPIQWAPFALSVGLNRLVSLLHLVLKLGVGVNIKAPPVTSLHGGHTDELNCTSLSLCTNDTIRIPPKGFALKLILAEYI